MLEKPYFKLIIILLSLLSLTSCLDFSQIKIIKNLEYGNYTTNNLQGKLLLDLYLPKNQNQELLPVLIYIHGGGWREGSKEDCPGKIVAEKGYALACINYRLSDIAIFPAQIHDVKKAVRWLRKNASKYNLNPDKFGAWGPSAGGHLSSLLGTSHGIKELEGEEKKYEVSSNVQAICNWYGATDFTQFTPAFTEVVTEEIFEKYRKKPWFLYTVAVTKVLGAPVAQRKQLAALANPINYIDENDPPFLIVHGKLDDVVPISQSEILVKALQSKNVAVEFISPPNLQHSYTGVNGELFDPQLIDMAITFFDRYLKYRELPRSIKKY